MRTSSAATTEVVIDGKHATKIGESAFMYNSDITRVIIPGSVTDIQSKAFGYYWDDISGYEQKVSNLTIYGDPGSAAEAYAPKNEFTFITEIINHESEFNADTETSADVIDKTNTVNSRGTDTGVDKNIIFFSAIALIIAALVVI